MKTLTNVHFDTIIFHKFCDVSRKRLRERGVCIQVRKERAVLGLRDGLRETDTEGSFGAGRLNGRVGRHGVVSVIEP